MVILRKYGFSIGLYLALMVHLNSFGQTESIPKGNQPKRFTQFEQKDLEERALRLTSTLGKYIQTIANRASSNNEKQEAVELAILLFMSEDKVVEVSNVHHSKINIYEIRDYLNRLWTMYYDDIQMKWYDITYVSDFKLGADGKIYGVATIYQVFKGFVEGKVVYKDVTKKNIEVILEQREDFDKNVYWAMLLGDITVEETSLE